MHVNSLVLIARASHSLNTYTMQTVEEIRRQKLALLIKEAGSQAELSDRTGKAPAQISQWLNASINSKTGKPRVMSNAIARELEEKMGKPNGWFDSPAPMNGSREAFEEDDFEDVPRIDVRLSGGDGSVAGYEEVIGSLKFASSFLRSVRVSPKKARIVSVRGHSMHPTVPDGSVLLINTADAAKEPVHGQIFALARPHEGLSVKRLKLEDGYWFATSDNPAGPRFRIDDGEPVKVIGRAVWMGTVLGKWEDG